MWLHRPALSRALILATTLFALPLAVGAARAQADALPAQGLYDTCEPASSPDGCAGRSRRDGFRNRTGAARRTHDIGSGADERS